jgi:trimeric autotransporter adhesin
MDGKEFSSIAEIKGTANASEMSTYEYTDENPFYGKNFYRLKQIDFDQEYTYSSIISVDMTAENSEVKISPNPVSSQLSIDFAAATEEMNSVEIQDLTGKNIFVEKFISTTGFNKKEISVQELLPGIYFMRVTVGKELNTFRVVKQ